MRLLMAGISGGQFWSRGAETSRGVKDQFEPAQPVCQRTAEWRLPAHLAPCRASWRRSVDRTDSRHSASAAGTALHAPLRSLVAISGDGPRCTFATFVRRPLRAHHRLPRVTFGAYYRGEDKRRNDTMDIGGWLRGLGLERYEQAFARTGSRLTYCRALPWRI